MIWYIGKYKDLIIQSYLLRLTDVGVLNEIGKYQ